MLITKIKVRLRYNRMMKARAERNNSKTEFLKDLPVISMGKHLVVYLNCPHPEKDSVHELFEESNLEVITHFVDKPVFLNKESAVQYGRYQGNSDAVVKLHVPESAIIAHDETLRLKKELLHHVDIHGCYVDWDGEESYVKNPNFSEA